MTFKRILLGSGVAVLAMLAAIDPSVRSFPLGGLSLGGVSAEAHQDRWQHGHRPHHRPGLPPILDTLEDLEFDADDDGPDDDEDGGHDDDTADDTDD